MCLLWYCANLQKSTDFPVTFDQCCILSKDINQLISYTQTTWQRLQAGHKFLQQKYRNGIHGHVMYSVSQFAGFQDCQIFSYTFRISHILFHIHSKFLPCNRLATHIKVYMGRKPVARYDFSVYSQVFFIYTKVASYTLSYTLIFFHIQSGFFIYSKITKKTTKSTLKSKYLRQEYKTQYREPGLTTKKSSERLSLSSMLLWCYSEIFSRTLPSGTLSRFQNTPDSAKKRM